MLRRVTVLQVLAVLMIALVVVSYGGSHTAWASDPEVTRVKQKLQSMMDNYSGPSSESDKSDIGGSSAQNASSAVTCWGKSHNIHRSHHPLTRGNVTGQSDTWCESRVSVIGVAAILYELRGDSYVRIASAPLKAKTWTNRKPVSVNPGTGCALNPLEYSTYLIIGFHVVAFSGGELGTAITGNSAVLRC